MDTYSSLDRDVNIVQERVQICWVYKNMEKLDNLIRKRLQNKREVKSMKRSKWLMHLIFLLIIMVMAACGNEESNGATGEDEKVELVYMTHSPENEMQKEIIETEVIGAFEEAHPDISVKWVHNEDPVTLIRQQMVAGGGPDIVLVDGPTQVVQFAKSDYLLPLDEFAKEHGWNDRYFDWAYDTGIVDETLYGLPGQYESLVVWYNKELFEANLCLSQKTECLIKNRLILLQHGI